MITNTNQAFKTLTILFSHSNFIHGIRVVSLLIQDGTTLLIKYLLKMETGVRLSSLIPLLQPERLNPNNGVSNTSDHFPAKKTVPKTRPLLEHEPLGSRVLSSYFLRSGFFPLRHIISHTHHWTAATKVQAPRTDGKAHPITISYSVGNSEKGERMATAKGSKPTQIVRLNREDRNLQKQTIQLHVLIWRPQHKIKP